jgi:hypothetical protein
VAGRTPVVAPSCADPSAVPGGASVICTPPLRNAAATEAPVGSGTPTCIGAAHPGAASSTSTMRIAPKPARRSATLPKREGMKAATPTGSMEVSRVAGSNAGQPAKPGR